MIVVDKIQQLRCIMKTYREKEKELHNMIAPYTALAIIALFAMVASLGLTKKISEKSGKEAIDLLTKNQVLVSFTIMVEVGVVYSLYMHGNTVLALMWVPNILLAMCSWHFAEKQTNILLSRID